MFLIGIPLLLIPVTIYHMIAFLTPDLEWSVRLASIRMISGREWIITLGDVVIYLALIMLFGEIYKTARPGSRTLVDHLLAVALFVGMVFEFVVWPQFVTTIYAFLIFIVLVDVLGGFAITIRTAHRDFSVERAGG